MLDTQGNEVKVGQRVVYNMSGELHCGIVVKIVPRAGYRNGVKNTYHIQKMNSEHISKVRNSTSIFVL